MKSAFRLIVALAVSQVAGIIGAFFTTPAIPAWYASLEKSTLNPPSWLFAPVWTTLFLLMGVAAFLVWQKGLAKKEVKVALAAFGAQLALNTLWSIIFFGMRSPGAALVEIVFLWVAIAATMVLFYKISKPAGLLFLPYIAWVSFAAFLNYSIWTLN